MRDENRCVRGHRLRGRRRHAPGESAWAQEPTLRLRPSTTGQCSANFRR